MINTTSWFNRSGDRIKDFLRRDSHVMLMLVAAALLVYALCLPNQMFWDDEDFILKNAFIKDWQYWPRFFTDNIIAGTHLVSNYWRPLLQAVFAVEWHLWADHVWGWHAISILSHAGTSIMLFLVMGALLKDRMLAILIALLWLVHPAHSEVVVYPNSMGDSLANIFVLAGVFCYAKFRQGATARPMNYYFIAIGMYVGALLSKETGILLVAFIALADFFFLTPPTTFIGKIRKMAVPLIPFILLAAIYMLLRATVLNFSNSFNFYDTETAFTSNFDIRLATFFRAAALYAGFIFIPWELRVERLIEPAKSFFELDVLWGMALCAGLVWLAVRNWTRRPAVAFGVLWAFIAILPTSNLVVIINAFVYEHFLYMSLAGIILIVLTFGMELATNKGTCTINSRQRIWYVSPMRIFFAVFITAFMLAGIRTAWRCLDWRTSVGFYEKLAPYVPTSYRVINNLGMAYAEHGMPEKARETYKKAIALDPNNAVAYHNLANICRDAKDKDLARQYYEKAISLQPSFIFSYKSLAQIYLDQNEYTKARRLLERYFDISEEKVYTLNILAEIAYREGAFAEAKRYLTILDKMLPNDPNTLAALDKLDALMKKGGSLSRP